MKFFESLKKHPFLWFGGASALAFLYLDANPPFEGALTVSKEEQFVPSKPIAGISLAPSGNPIVLYKSIGISPEKGINSPGAMGMDSTGQWWMNYASTAIRITPTYGDSALESINKFVTNIVVPAIGAVLGTVVGGPVGFAAAIALTTWANLARGSSISEAFNESLKKSGITDRAIIENTYKRILNEGPSLDDINKLRSVISDEDSKKAFDTGVMLAKAQKTQEVLAAFVSVHLPGTYREGFNKAFTAGGQIRDFIGANFGSAGLEKLDFLSKAAAKEIAANPKGLSL